MKKRVPQVQQRRWRDIPKDELDAELSSRGKPIPLTEAERKASAMRKQNKARDGRQGAAKRKEREGL